jgi:hypothetical protein
MLAIARAPPHHMVIASAAGIRELQAALSTAWASRTDSTLIWRDSRLPHTSAKRLIDSRARFSSVAGISCTLTVSSRSYFAVFAWLSADGGFWLRRPPQHPEKIDQRWAAANSACIMRAVADGFTISTEHGVEQGNCAQAFFGMGSCVHIRISQLVRCSHAKFFRHRPRK